MEQNDNLLRILFVEDNDARIEHFRRWVSADCHPVFARSAGRALKMIELDGESEYGGICLDYDLDEQVVAQSERSFNGMHVVRKIVETVPRNVPILIHSMNTGGGRSMVRLLEAEHFSVTYIPFRYLDAPRFKDWLEDVLAKWEYRER